MSTEAPTRRTRAQRRRSRGFAGAFIIVLGVLAVLGLGGAAVTTTQGPRVTDTQVDPAAAAAASGARLIVTTTQSLAPVDASQVVVDPAVPFSVDTSGRSVGVRFGMPLRDATEYTVTISDVQGVGGGPTADIVSTFTTPAAEVFLLQRGDGEDTVFRTDLTGEQAVPVFRHPHIEDYRATATHLVMSVVDETDAAQLIVTDLEGGGERTLPLPGNGTVSNLQSADRGELIGYTYTDADLSAADARESALFTASLRDADAEDAPTPVEVEGSDVRVAQWRFVPDTDSVLLLSFDGALLLTDGSGENATALGSALALDGVAGTTAIVERLADGMVVLDLSDGSETPLVGVDPDGPALGGVVPVPGGGTLRTMTVSDEAGLPLTVTVDLVTDEGEATSVFAVAPDDALVHVCASPSGRYAAVLIAPDAIDNPYDAYQLPLPITLETHVVELPSADTEGGEVVALAGFAISWCQVPPQ